MVYVSEAFAILGVSPFVLVPVLGPLIAGRNIRNLRAQHRAPHLIQPILRMHVPVVFTPHICMYVMFLLVYALWLARDAPPV
jgi:hypothetical protein